MKLRLVLTGTTPLLMRNARLADPLDPFAKAMKVYTGKKVKVDEDHIAMARLDWEGGIYFDDELGPYVPGAWIHGTMIKAGTFTKHGTEMKRSLTIMDDMCPLIYTGPRDIESMYADKRFVCRRRAGVGTRSVMRTRPQFRDWSVNAEVMLDESRLDLRTVENVLRSAGDLVGIGDYRPTFGRFTGEIVVI